MAVERARNNDPKCKPLKTLSESEVRMRMMQVWAGKRREMRRVAKATQDKLELRNKRAVNRTRRIR